MWCVYVCLNFGFCFDWVVVIRVGNVFVGIGLFFGWSGCFFGWVGFVEVVIVDWIENFDVCWYVDFVWVFNVVDKFCDFICCMEYDIYDCVGWD